MLKAYVGIARSDGLVSLCPDDEETNRRFSLASVRGDRHGVYFGAAASDEVFRQVQQEMATGDRVGALKTLDALAAEIAPL